MARAALGLVVAGAVLMVAHAAQAPEAEPHQAPAVNSSAAAFVAPIETRPRDDAPLLDAPARTTATVGKASTANDSERSAPTSRARRGWVHVVVQPWGNVWIDGVWMGRAPVEARVSKGRHTIEVGRELPSRQRVVNVEPGAREELEINLRD